MKEVKVGTKKMVVELLRENIFYKFGFLRDLVTDQGSQFTSNLIEEIMEQPIEAPKIGSTTRGIPNRFRPWLAAPYPFGIAGPTGDNGTSFAI